MAPPVVVLHAQHCFEWLKFRVLPVALAPDVGTAEPAIKHGPHASAYRRDLGIHPLVNHLVRRQHLETESGPAGGDGGRIKY